VIAIVTATAGTPAAEQPPSLPSAYTGTLPDVAGALSAHERVRTSLASTLDPALPPAFFSDWLFAIAERALSSARSSRCGCNARAAAKSCGIGFATSERVRRSV